MFVKFYLIDFVSFEVKISLSIRIKTRNFFTCINNFITYMFIQLLSFVSEKFIKFFISIVYLRKIYKTIDI